MYYQQWMEDQAQKLVNATGEHLFNCSLTSNYDTGDRFYSPSILAKAYKDGSMPVHPYAAYMRPPGGAMIPPPGAMAGAVLRSKFTFRFHFIAVIIEKTFFLKTEV